jgi:hypothetical protein
MFRLAGSAVRNFVVLKLAPAVEQRLFCVNTAPALLTANRALGIDGVAISPAGLAMDFDNLLKTAQPILPRQANRQARRKTAASRLRDGRRATPEQALTKPGVHGRR